MEYFDIFYTVKITSGKAAGMLLRDDAVIDLDARSKYPDSFGTQIITSAVRTNIAHIAQELVAEFQHETGETAQVIELSVTAKEVAA